MVVSILLEKLYKFVFLYVLNSSKWINGSQEYLFVDCTIIYSIASQNNLFVCIYHTLLFSISNQINERLVPELSWSEHITSLTNLG